MEIDIATVSELSWMDILKYIAVVMVPVFIGVIATLLKKLARSDENGVVMAKIATLEASAEYEIKEEKAGLKRLKSVMYDAEMILTDREKKIIGGKKALRKLVKRVFRMAVEPIMKGVVE